ncbi:hypothetical protein [Dictyobacter aurantiacus]|uniref:DUF1453 domain-containing protein n=1 Tax=Dictyobacter aurantiacus TaxID=1936993 RepID=A0A401ZM16_9CHLR|nr:hypothetical protein [Dictyobacter aurantiacus]GCE07878.1 hypothetical protein KDAU_52070 [Dictyobacter aurantiacus]
MPSLTNLAFPLILLLLLAILMWLQSKEKRTSIRALWVRMLIITALCMLSFSHTAISNVTHIALLIACGFVGLIIGIMSGRMAKFQADIANHAIIVQGTTWSLGIWAAIFLINQGSHLLSTNGTQGVLVDLIGANVLFLTTCFVLGMHICWYWRYSLQRRRTSISTP